MPLTDEQKESIKRTMRKAYSDVPKTGYKMEACWTKDEEGNFTVDGNCLRNGGEKIGQEIKNLWGK